MDSTEYPITFPANTELVNAQGSRWRFVYSTNKLGKRGLFIPLSVSYETSNVVVLGDSFTFGFGVNDSEVYTDILSSRIGDTYSVINGGMGGWGIDSEIKWYYKVGAQYKPSYVVLQFTANDPDDSLLGVTRIVDDRFAFFPYNRPRAGWQIFLSQSFIFQNSHLYVLIRNIYDSLCARNVFRQKQPDTINDKSQANSIIRSQQNYVELLELFAHKLHSQGIVLIFVSVTHPHGDNGGYHYEIEDLPVIKNAINHLAVTGMLHFIELPLDIMRQHPGSPEGHQWAAIHHKLVGEAIADKLLGLEDKRHVVGTPGTQK